METTIFLAKAWGLLLTIVSLSFLINPDGIKRVIHHMKDEANIFIAGYVTLIIGILSVLAHNVWVGYGPVATIVTVFGWLTLVKGTLRILFPRTIARWIGYFEEHFEFLKLVVLVGLVFGVYLLFIVF